MKEVTITIKTVAKLTFKVLVGYRIGKAFADVLHEVAKRYAVKLNKRLDEKIAELKKEE